MTGASEETNKTPLAPKMPTSRVPSVGGIPVSAAFILVVELCERFAFYGSTAAFPLYMVGMLNWTLPQTNIQNNTFMFWSYFTAIIGGYLADSYWGKFKTILVFAVAYLSGLVLLTVSSVVGFGDYPLGPATSEGGWANIGFILSCFFIGLGTGGIKSNVSTMVGEQLPNQRDEDIERVFRYFYWAINAGALLGNIISPFLHRYGPVKQITVDGEITEINTSFWASFLAPTLAFCVGVPLFLAGTKWYIRNPPRGSILTTFTKTVSLAFKHRREVGQGLRQAPPNRDSFFDWARGAEIDDAFINDLKLAMRACRIFLFFPVYWMLYNQMSNNFVQQGSWMDSPEWLTSDQLQVINPLFLVVMIPIFDTVIFPGLRKLGLVLGPIARMTIGFVISGSTFILAGFLQLRIASVGSWNSDDKYTVDGDESKVSIWFQIPMYALIAMSEIFASISALEFAYSQAPKSMKSIVMSLFLLTNAGGSLIGLAVSPLMSPENFTILFFSFSGAMLLFAVVFYALFRSMVVTAVQMNDDNSGGIAGSHPDGMQDPNYHPLHEQA